MRLEWRDVVAQTKAKAKTNANTNSMMESGQGGEEQTTCTAAATTTAAAAGAQNKNAFIASAPTPVRPPNVSCSCENRACHQSFSKVH